MINRDAEWLETDGLGGKPSLVPMNRVCWQQPQ
jgi:hypothetical protein